MAIHFQAVYRAGAIHPDQPLGLPDDTAVVVTMVPVVGDPPMAQDPSAPHAGQQMAAILERLAATPARPEIDPVAWQRQQREDRPLPGRTD